MFLFQLHFLQETHWVYVVTDELPHLTSHCSGAAAFPWQKRPTSSTSQLRFILVCSDSFLRSTGQAPKLLSKLDQLPYASEQRPQYSTKLVHYDFSMK